MALRIEAFAEPMFAASIITYGVFVGAADTLVPCLMNFFNIRAVRLSLAALLAPSLGMGCHVHQAVFQGVDFPDPLEARTLDETHVKKCL